MSLLRRFALTSFPGDGCQMKQEVGEISSTVKQTVFKILINVLRCPIPLKTKTTWLELSFKMSVTNKFADSHLVVNDV